MTPLFLLVALLALLSLASCDPSSLAQVVVELPTLASSAATAQPDTPTPTPDNSLAPTFTPESQSVVTLTPAGEFVFTPRPTHTPFPTPFPTSTRTPIPTQTPLPTETPLPTDTPAPTSTPTSTSIASGVISSVPAGDNLLQNPSFEMGFDNPNGTIELQIPKLWTFEYKTGNNALDPDDWNKWVRPEVRVLTKSDIPSHEHDDFFVSSNQTVKIFKGYGSVSFKLVQNLTLEPGKYQFTVHVFPDMVMEYTQKAKIYADDYRAAEIGFLTNGNQSDWQFVPIGKKNRYGYVFEVDQTKTVQVGLAARGRWALQNNGWFIDGFSLVKID